MQLNCHSGHTLYHCTTVRVGGTRTFILGSLLCLYPIYYFVMPFGELTLHFAICILVTWFRPNLLETWGMHNWIAAIVTDYRSHLKRNGRCRCSPPLYQYNYNVFRCLRWPFLFHLMSFLVVDGFLADVSKWMRNAERYLIGWIRREAGEEAGYIPETDAHEMNVVFGDGPAKHLFV